MWWGKALGSLLRHRRNSRVWQKNSLAQATCLTESPISRQSSASGASRRRRMTHRHGSCSRKRRYDKRASGQHLWENIYWCRSLQTQKMRKILYPSRSSPCIHQSIWSWCLPARNSNFSDFRTGMWPWAKYHSYLWYNYAWWHTWLASVAPRENK